MHFTAIHLENWANFKKLDLELRSRVFIVGPNAAGKSNLLDAFRFLRDIVERGLRHAVNELRPGFSALRSLHAGAYSDVVLDMKMDLDGQAWRYELRLNQDKQRRIVVKSETAWEGKDIRFSRGDDDSDPTAQSQTFLEQAQANKKFRAVADFFRQVRYLHVVPQLVREPDRATAFRGHPFGAELLEQLSAFQRQNPRAFKGRLGAINKALRVAVPRFQELHLEKDDRGSPHLEARYDHWRARGGWQSERQFSDGTLRLFGLLWALLDGAGPLLLEEPELALHPALVRELPGLIWRLSRRNTRQVFLSTHSAEMLQDPGIQPDEVVLLQPGDKGTTAQTADSLKEVIPLLNRRVPLSEIVLPHVAPKNVNQLSLFTQPE